MKEQIVLRRRGAARKYDWDKLRIDGWIFIELEPGHSNQGNSIRSSARGQGLCVSAMRADMGNATGFLVSLVK